MAFTIVVSWHVTALCVWKLSAAHTCNTYIAHLVVVRVEHLDMLKRSIGDIHSQNSSRSKIGVDAQQESLDTSFLNAVPQQCNHALHYAAQASTGQHGLIATAGQPGESCLGVKCNT